MSRRKKNDVFSEAIVGIFMIAVLALLVYFTIIISGVDVLKGRQKVIASIAFNGVGGLKEHDNVMYRGTKVGGVEDILVTPSNLVVKIEIDKLAARLKDQGHEFSADPEVVSYLIDKGFQAEYGARPLRRAIERYLEDPLAEEILRGYFRESEPIIARMDNNAVVFLPGDTEKIAEPAAETPPKKSRRKKKDE